MVSYNNYLAKVEAGDTVGAKASLKTYNAGKSDAQRTAVAAIKMAMEAEEIYEKVLNLVDQANRAVELLTEAGAAESLILEVESCALSTIMQLPAVEAKALECQSYVDTIYANAIAGGLTREEIDEDLEEEEDDKADEEEIVDKFFIDNGYIVAVTYGEDDGTPYKTFILNYNNFAVTVKYTINGEERVYTVPGSEYVEIYY